MKSDALISALSERREHGSSDAAVDSLAMLATYADAAERPAVELARVTTARRGLRGRRRLGVAMGVALACSSTGIAAAVTGDPLAPVTFVVKHLHELADRHAVDDGWNLGRTTRHTQPDISVAPATRAVSHRVQRTENHHGDAPSPRAEVIPTPARSARVLAEPRTVPAREVTEPRTVPAREVAEPRAVPAREVAEPRAVPAREVTEPRTVPAREVTQPRTAPAREVTQPRTAPSRPLSVGSADEAHPETAATDTSADNARATDPQSPAPNDAGENEGPAGKPTEPTEPTEPSEPTEPTEAAKPTEPRRAAEPRKAAESTSERAVDPSTVPTARHDPAPSSSPKPSKPPKPDPSRPEPTRPIGHENGQAPPEPSTETSAAAVR